MAIEYFIEKICLYFEKQFPDKLNGIFLIGDFEGDQLNDIDLVAIISDSASKIDFITKTSDKIISWSARLEILISVFPVFESDFVSEKTMFLKNVKKYGKKLYD